MIEQVAQKNLIRTTYFISPEYMSITRCGITGPDENCMMEEGHSGDKRDTIHHWWSENTLNNKLMGENGVWCEVGSIPVYDRKRREQIGETTKTRCGRKRWKYNEPYRRVVEVKSMPSSRKIPFELLEALTEREYKEIESDDVFVKKSYRLRD